MTMKYKAIAAALLVTPLIIGAASAGSSNVTLKRGVMDASATVLVSSKKATPAAKQKWKRATWERFYSSPRPGAEIPPTDCPPLPEKECLDTWELTSR